MKHAVVSEHTQRDYLPAAGHDFLLPAYDLVNRILGSDSARRELLDWAQLASGQRILDIGCGTGTLAVELKQGRPDLEITGIDPDPKALARARHKAERAGVAVEFIQGYAAALPFPEASFDRVFSSFMFHHLEPEQKPRMAGEVRRVLRPGGLLYLLDFSSSQARQPEFLSRLFHSHHRLEENSEEKILGFLRDAGLVQANIFRRRTLLFGLARLAYFQASAGQASGG